MYHTDKTIVFLNGKFLKAKDAQCSLYSQTLHYGNGVFEGIRAYNTNNGVRIFKGKEHFERLKNSAEQMAIPFDYSIEELEQICYNLLNKNQLKDAYIRPMIFMEDNMTLAATTKSNIFIGTWKWARYLGDKLLDTCISSFERPSSKAFPVNGKVTGMYASAVLATTEARRKGFDEAIMLDNKGFVAQGPGTNIFYEKDSELFTPPKGNIVPGITRQTIIDLARQRDIKVTEKQFTVEELKKADAAFFTGTAAEIVGIGSIDGIVYKMDYKHTRYHELSEAYLDLVRTAFEPAYTII